MKNITHTNTTPHLQLVAFSNKAGAQVIATFEGKINGKDGACANARRYLEEVDGATGLNVQSVAMVYAGTTHNESIYEQGE